MAVAVAVAVTVSRLIVMREFRSYRSQFGMGWGLGLPVRMKEIQDWCMVVARRLGPWG